MWLFEGFGVGHTRAIVLAATEVVAPVVIAGAHTRHLLPAAKTSLFLEVLGAMDFLEKDTGEGASPPD